MGKPRNFDGCWRIDEIVAGHVIGHRETRGQYVYEPWFRLEVGTIKVFPQTLVLIEAENDYSFIGEALTVVAVYEERPLD